MAYVGALVGAIVGYSHAPQNSFEPPGATEEELKAEAKKLAGYLSKLSGKPTSQKVQLQQLAGKLDPEAKQAAVYGIAKPFWDVTGDEHGAVLAEFPGAVWSIDPGTHARRYSLPGRESVLIGLEEFARMSPADLLTRLAEAWPPPEPDHSYDINDLSPVSRARIAALKEEE